MIIKVLFKVLLRYYVARIIKVLRVLKVLLRQ